jgi:hypothetical protein
MGIEGAVPLRHAARATSPASGRGEGSFPRPLAGEVDRAKRETERDRFHANNRAAFNRAKSSPAWCDERVSGDDDTMRKPFE